MRPDRTDSRRLLRADRRAQGRQQPALHVGGCRARRVCRVHHPESVVYRLRETDADGARTRQRHRLVRGAFYFEMLEVTKRLHRLVGDPHGLRLLDIGCGPPDETYTSGAGLLVLCY